MSNAVCNPFVFAIVKSPSPRRKRSAHFPSSFSAAMQQRSLQTALSLLVFFAYTAVSQRNAKFFRGQHPRDSRIYGSSSSARVVQQEETVSMVAQPFRLLIAGDDIARGCGYKAYPPEFANAECTHLDFGFRGRLLSHLRADSGAEIEMVGNFATPDGSEHRHCAEEGLLLKDLAKINYVSFAPHIILFLCGMSDILSFQSPRIMAATVEDMLVKLSTDLPNVRIVVASILDVGGAETTPEQRSNLQAFNAYLPGIVKRRREGAPPPASRVNNSVVNVEGASRSMQIYFADLHKNLPSLCRYGSGATEKRGHVPVCTQNELVPTKRGCKDLVCPSLVRLILTRFFICCGRPNR